jgi:ABC-2 type transport system ATP-binding protein
MRTQLLLALAVGKEPSVYILDEPTSGLDPVVRRHVLRFLDDEARQKGRTILLSSHVLSELNDICTHVAVLDRGCLKLESELQQLRSQWRKYEFSCRNLNGSLRELGPANYEKRGDVYTLFVGGDHDKTRACLDALSVDGLRVAEMQLEEIFFSIIGSEPTAVERENHE